MSEQHRVWWKEPMVWMIFGLPLSAVVAGMLTIWFAANNADTLVYDNYRKDGLAISQDTAREDIAQQLGLSANVTATETALSVSLSGNLAPEPEKLIFTLLHPTETRGDIQFTLEKQGDGHYQTALPAQDMLNLVPEQERVVIEPENRAWRLSGNWTTPLKGALTIQPTQQNSSTHP